MARSTVFFDWEGVVHHKHTSPGQAVNKGYYLSRLRDAIWQKLPQLWSLVIGSFITTTHLLVHPVSCRVLAKPQITQVTQRPLQSRFGTLRLLAFPKIKITFEREGFSDCAWDSQKYNRAADGDWKNCVRSQGAYFEGDWGIIICIMYNVPCIVFNKCLYFSYSMAAHFLDKPHVYLYGHTYIYIFLQLSSDTSLYIHI